MIFKTAIKKKRTNPESELQMECVALIQDYKIKRGKLEIVVPAKYRDYNFFCYSIPNERSTSAFMGWIFNRMGRKKGFPDFCIVEKDKHIYFEFKSKDGKVSAEQKECITRLAWLGHVVHVVDNIEDFEKIVLLVISRRDNND